MSGHALHYPYELVADGYGAVFVLFPDVPGAMTFAGSEEDALARAARALRAALDDYGARGAPLPVPSEPDGRPVMTVDRSELWRGGTE